jgi:hypothetical protein
MHFSLRHKFILNMNIMEPRKAPKKSKEAGESSSPEGDVVSDTTSHAIDSIKSWRQMFDNLDYEIKNFSDDSKNKLWDIADSKLRKVATRPQLIKYTEMISWALERKYVQTIIILDSQGVIIGSFRLEHIQVMYKLSPNSK